MDAKLKEFMQLVEQMRTAQKEYFKAEYGTLSKNDWLGKSKQLEKQVDAAIKELEDPQVKLF